MSRRDENFYADARLIAEAVRAEADRSAYLATGGSDGCAQCTRGGPLRPEPPMTFGERVERGHLDCAEALAATKGARATASGMSEVWIEISRAMEDPRFGQWILDREASR